jgi:hypothetical protein
MKSLAILTVVIFVAGLGVVSARAYETPVPSSVAPRSVGAEPVLPSPANPNLARIYFYRADDPIGTPQWTAVWLNGARVGDSAPGAYFFRDVQPGTYSIAVRSERSNPEQSNSITVAPGSTTCVEIYSVDIYELQLGGSYYRPAIFADRVVPQAAAQAVIARLQQQEERTP